MSLRFAIAAVAAVLPILTTTARAETDREEQLRKGAQMLEARAAYQAHCASCHGETGDGRGATEVGAAPPPDFTAPAAVAEMTRPRMIEAVRAGHGTEASARWTGKLGEAQIAAVVDYVREAFMLPAPDADASLGRKIYARTCSVCHGERGDAASWAKNSLNPPPANFTAKDPSALTRQRMINTVTYGSSGTAMMPFATQFTREELAAVIDYIRATFMKEGAAGGDAAAAGAALSAPADSHAQHAAVGTAPQAAPAEHAHQEPDHAEHGMEGGEVDMSAAFPSGVVGRYAHGKTFYDDNCSACHGLEGKGNGPRAYFLSRKPEDFTSAEARAEFNRPHLFQAIAKGVLKTEMPAWSKVIGAQQIADVAEYVFAAFIQPAPPPGGSQAGAATPGEDPAKKN